MLISNSEFDLCRWIALIGFKLTDNMRLHVSADAKSPAAASGFENDHTFMSLSTCLCVPYALVVGDRSSGGTTSLSQQKQPCNEIPDAEDIAREATAGFPINCTRRLLQYSGCQRPIFIPISVLESPCKT